MLSKTSHLGQELMKINHKFARYGKNQRMFVLYLLALVFFLVLFPVIKVAPVNDSSYSVWLIGGSLFKVMLVVFASLAILVGWNMSFRFKNIVISYFGFKENDALFNFGFLWIITTAFLSIGDTLNVVHQTTSTIYVTFRYWIIELMLLAGLILTLISVIKKAKSNSKTKIINIVDEGAAKDIHNKKSLKGLFEEDNED